MRYHGAVSSELQRLPAPAESGLALSTSDARDDDFVRQHMVPAGAPLQLARLYTQPRRGIAMQVGFLSAMMGLGSGMVLGSALAGLGVAAAGVVAVGALLMLETSGRIALTPDTFVVQAGVLMRRYERAYIEEARVEWVKPSKYVRLELSLFEPPAFFRPTKGLRFRYAPPKGRAREVFVAIPDAEDLLARLGG